MRSPDTVIAAWPPTAGGPPAGRAACAAGGASDGRTGSAVVTELLSRAYRAGYPLGDAKVVDEHHRPEQQRDRHALAMNVKQGAAGFFAHADFRADEGVLAYLEVTVPGLGDLVARAERVLDRGRCFVGPYPGTAHFDVWHSGLLWCQEPGTGVCGPGRRKPGTPRVRGSPYKAVHLAGKRLPPPSANPLFISLTTAWRPR